MNLIRSVLTLFFLLLFRTLVADAQQEGKFIDQSQESHVPFTIVRYGTRYGLPQNQVTDIIPKKNGIILSTANGIAEYNGSEFYEFIGDKTHKHKLHYRLFWHEGRQRLFGAVLGGVNSLYPSYHFIDSLYAVNLRGNTLLGVDRNGRLLQRGIDEQTFRPVMKTGIRKAFIMYTDGYTHYISNEFALYRVNERSQRVEVLLNEPVVRIRKNPYDGKIYAACFNSHRLYELLPSGEPQEVILDHGISKADLVLSDIAFTDADTWFIATNKGLIYRTRRGTSVYGERYLPTPRLECLYYNRQESCLFIGTQLDGLLKLQFKSCISYYDSPGIGDASLGSIIRLKSGRVLAAGSGRKVFSIRPGGIHEYYRSTSSVASLAAISGDPDVVHVGTWGKGIQVVRNGELIDSITGNQLPDLVVHAIFKDTRGRLWIGTGHGIAMGATVATIRPILKQIRESIICFYERRNGTICVGTMGSVYLLGPSGKILKRLSVQQGLTGKETRAFYEDKEGKLWIGTYDGGLYCYHNGRLTSINRKPNCHLSMDAFTLARDARGYLLMSSNKGLWMISEKKLNDFYYDRIPYLVPFYYGEESGVLNTEFNGGAQNNYLQDSPHTFYFPTIQGLVYKKDLRPRFRKLVPVFRSILINDTLRPMNSHRFERATHTIRFDFFCQNYTDKFNLYYQYKLNGPGLPDEWSPLQKEGTVSFKILPPGSYVLSIRAIDGFNDNSPVVRTYAFEVLPYFYETTWFRVLGIVLVILGIAGVIRYRYYRSLEKASRENKINHTILELKLKAIQSKMDPHFIFNALNNIIYLLNAEKYQEAEELVQDFSLLLRRFLEKSDSTFLSLGEELAIIDLYLLVEQKRYNEQFTYAITIDDRIVDSKIPTLLIQPLVENAIKHGISHTDRPCSIRINAVQTAEGIVITIEDDGIGMERAARINRQRKDHVSRGIALVKEKIGMMYEKYGIAIRLELLDNSNGEHTGTISRLTIVRHD